MNPLDTTTEAHANTGPSGAEELPHYAPIRYPVLDKPCQPLVVDSIEKTTNVHIKHPAHLLPRNPYREGI